MSTVWVRDEKGKLVREEKKKKKRQLMLPFGDGGAKVEKPIESDFREVGASISRTDLFLKCQWWVGRKVPRDPPNEYSSYGRAFHELIAVKLLVPPKKISTKAVAKEHGVEDVAALKEHVRNSLEYLIGWLKGGNPYKVNFIKRAQARTEQAFAWNVFKKTARGIRAPSKDRHEYKNLKPGELPGTADWVIDRIETKKDAPELVVIDHKTGQSIDLPKDSGQIKTLLVAASKRMGYKRVAGGIFHTPKDGAPYLYIDEFKKDELAEHADKLKTAWGGIGQGSLNPGDWCQGCPAFSICPVYASAIGQMEKMQSGILTAEKIGRAHEVISRFMSWSVQYRETVIRPWVVRNGPAIRPDGKLVTLRKKEVRNLSMSSIERKLGKVAGQKRIAALDKEGLIEYRTQEELVAVADK